MHNLGVRMSGSKSVGDPLRDPGKVQHAQQNEHETDRQFHRQPDFYRDRQVENDDARSNHENRQRVAQSPESANQACMANAVLAAYDRGDGDDVVGISRVPHPKQESESDNGEQVGQTGHEESRAEALPKPIAPPVYL